MKKYISSLICFLVAACTIASSTFFDMGSAASLRTVPKMTTEYSEADEVPQHNADLFADAFSVKGFNRGFFNSNSKYFAGKWAYAADADMKIVFFDNSGVGNAFVDQGSVLELDTSQFTLAVSRVYKVDNTDAPFAQGTTMSFSIAGAGNNVIKIEPDANPNDNSVVLTRMGPGRANVNVAITENGTTRYATVTIHVAFEIVQTSPEWEETTLTGFGNKVLFLDQRDYLGTPNYYQLDILYMDSTVVTADSVILDSSDRQYDDTIVSYSNGRLYVRGAGYTRVTLSTTGANADKVSFYVLVSPIGHSEPVIASGSGVTYADYMQTFDMGTIYADNFAVYSNATKASTLSWTVYSVDKNGTPHEIAKNDHSRLTYDVSEHSGVVNFSNVKAGTYRIIGRANPSFADTESRNMVVYNVIVMLSLEPTVLYMNVGDTYDVLANSNIPENLYNALYDIEYAGNSRLYAEVDNKGIITAKNVGTSQITFKYVGGSNNSLFPPSVSGSVGNVVYTIHVIDYLSISNSLLASDGATEFVMYAGGEYPLYAACTNRDYDIYWESLDTSIVTVSDNGYGSVMVKALKKGVVTIRAYQIINGVEKNAYAEITVKNTATKVTLSPAKVEVEVDDYKTIVAQFVGDSTELTWVTSDPTIFEFVDGVNVGTSATIQAKKPGTAVLTAINPNNIVCGYCEVTVFQEVTGLRLSEYNLTLDEHAGTYQMYAYLEPGNASDSSVLWTSSKPSVVSVDANGKLTILKEGEATIMAQSVLNPEFFALCTVKVLQGVDNIKLDKNELELYKGEIFRLPYVITPADASNETIQISVFDTSVVSVTKGEDRTLLVTGRGVGTTTFMVMTQDGKYWDLCTVTVKQVATGAKINYTEVTLNVGEWFDLEVTLEPRDATESSLSWQSLDPRVASVSAAGRIMGLSVGKTTVMVSTQSGKNSFCTVTVLQGAQSMELDEERITIGVGETYTLTPIFNPNSTSNTAVRWEVEDDSVATVNEAGMITGLKGGYTMVTATTLDGNYSDSCLVKVEELITRITVDPSSYRLGKGKTVVITATLLAGGGDNSATISDPELVWYSDDESVATVNQFGEVKGVDYGKTTITVEAAAGDAYATVEIEVVKEVTEIRLNSSYEEIVVGHKFQLDATVGPKDATYTGVRYKVVDPKTGNEDKSIAIVSNDGEVTGLKKGDVWVVADALDNSGVQGICVVKVIDPINATKITVVDEEITLLPGESKKINATVLPVKNTDALTWTTNNDTVASVSQDGTITANTIGETTVTVISNSGKTAKVAVTVLGLSRNYIEIPVYSSFRIYLDGVNSTVRWDVDNPQICDVANGNITARKMGVTIVTAKVNGRTLECIVKVTR